MKARTLAIIPLLILSLGLTPTDIPKARAVVPNPTGISMTGECCTPGDPVGWVTNETDLASAVSPTLSEFAGVKFTFRVQAGDFTHDFAIYANGTLPNAVLLSNHCSTSNSSGCLARSAAVTYPSATTFSFTPLSSVIPSNFAGVGGYEYFCEYHPTLMHGHISVYKTTDMSGPSGGPNGIVDIFDIAFIAFHYSSKGFPTPTATWNATADLNNDGQVNILDVAKAAYYYGAPF